MKRLVAALLMCVAVAAQAVPSFAEVQAAHRPSDLTLLDRHGLPLQTLRTDPTVRRLPWVPIADLSPALLNAIVLSEDRAFYEHSGVDWGAVAASAWGNLWNTRTRGASTLTMQLAGLIDEDLARPAAGRSVAQKLGQALLARRLEARWSKAQILEAYLNRAAFRGELVGIAALSQTLFGKFPSGLDAEEAAIAAALLRAPNAAPAVVAQRACGVLTLQGRACAGVEGLALAALARRGGPPLGEQLAPHLAHQVDVARAAPDGRLATTLDASLQRLAVAALRHQLAELAGRNVHDGALLVLDNASGEVRAWVGSSGPLSAASQVDGVLARRQPGSTLKPFVYGLAFERRLITPATLLDDAPTRIGTTNGLYLPRNYDGGYKGWVSARSALGASLNVPAVRVGTLLGSDALFERLNAFGLELPHSGGHYGASLALGSADVSLLALTNAYRALANGGLHGAVRWQPGAAPVPKRVATAAAVYLVTDILADNNARALTFGLDSVLATRGFAAVKTGTSKDLRDNWCVGFTDRYTVGVWVGNADGDAMHDVSGSSGAAPVWQTLVRALHESLPSRRPVPPAGVVAVQVAHAAGADGWEPPRAERLLAGTEWTSDQGVPAATSRFGIAHPREGSVFALDPDIPPAAQRIRLEGEDGVWRLDGRVLGRRAALSWAPTPGRHELVWQARDGRRRERVAFEVRGAAWQRASLSAATTAPGR
ncbi:MAG TPA: penicillin-binding protein 1C [Methylibium sp.]|nr:penicillin-binding protein 1C [Methylibium sp.]